MEMTDQKKQIVGWVGQVDEIKEEAAEHWSMAKRAVADGKVDDAISLLNRYFRLKVKLEKVESSLASLLHGYFSDK
jgi:hypothetical protein